MWRHTRTVKFHNMQISNYRYLTEVFQNLQNNLGINENSSQFAIEARKTNVLTWGLFMSSATKAAIHPGPNYNEILEIPCSRKSLQTEGLFGELVFPVADTGFWVLRIVFPLQKQIPEFRELISGAVTPNTSCVKTRTDVAGLVPRGAAMRDRSFHLGGSWARTISPSK